MVDRNKRRTLKIMSAGSVATMSAATMAGIGFSNATLAGVSASDSVNTDLQINGAQLSIQIITGGTVPEDTVIFTNHTSEDIVISEFLPGFITVKNQMIDLNELCRDTALTVSPDYPLASSAARWELLALDHSSSYLWCDTAEETLSEFTGVVKVHAAVANGRAMLTAVQPQTIFS